jgi:hypothetical protein
MKKLVMPAAFLSAIGLSVWLTHAQVAGAPRHVAWEYAQYGVIGGANSYYFATPGPRLSADSLVGLYTAMTGRRPQKHAADQAGDCTTVDILNAAGAQGWEVVGDKEGPLGTVVTFKRVAQ